MEMLVSVLTHSLSISSDIFLSEHFATECSQPHAITDEGDPALLV